MGTVRLLQLHCWGVWEGGQNPKKAGSCGSTAPASCCTQQGRSPLPRAAERVHLAAGAEQIAASLKKRLFVPGLLTGRRFNNSALLGRNSLARNAPRRAGGSGAAGAGPWTGLSPPELRHPPGTHGLEVNPAQPRGVSVGSPGSDPSLLLDPEPEQPPGTSVGAPGAGTAPCPRGLTGTVPPPRVLAPGRVQIPAGSPSSTGLGWLGPWPRVRH